MSVLMSHDTNPLGRVHFGVMEGFSRKVDIGSSDDEDKFWLELISDSIYLVVTLPAECHFD